MSKRLTKFQKELLFRIRDGAKYELLSYPLMSHKHGFFKSIAIIWGMAKLSALGYVNWEEDGNKRWVSITPSGKKFNDLFGPNGVYERLMWNSTYGI